MPVGHLLVETAGLTYLRVTVTLAAAVSPALLDTSEGREAETVLGGRADGGAVAALGALAVVRTCPTGLDTFAEGRHVARRAAHGKDPVVLVAAGAVQQRLRARASGGGREDRSTEN